MNAINKNSYNYEILFDARSYLPSLYHSITLHLHIFITYYFF